MKNKEKTITIGFAPIFIILLVLKLSGVNISWFWVFSPFWLPFAIIFSGFAIVIGLAVCMLAFIIPVLIIYALLGGE